MFTDTHIFFSTRFFVSYALKCTRSGCYHRFSQPLPTSPPRLLREFGSWQRCQTVRAASPDCVSDTVGRKTYPPCRASCIYCIVATARSEEGNRNYRNKVNQTVGRTRTTFNINAVYYGYSGIDDNYYTYRPTPLLGTLSPSRFHHHYYKTRTLTHVVQFEAHTTDHFCGRPIACRTGGIRAPPPVEFETLRICCIACAPEQSWKIKKYQR